MVCNPFTTKKPPHVGASNRDPNTLLRQSRERINLKILHGVVRGTLIEIANISTLTLPPLPPCSVQPRLETTTMVKDKVSRVAPRIFEKIKLFRQHGFWSIIDTHWAAEDFSGPTKSPTPSPLNPAELKRHKIENMWNEVSSNASEMRKHPSLQSCNVADQIVAFCSLADALSQFDEGNTVAFSAELALAKLLDGYLCTLHNKITKESATCAYEGTLTPAYVGTLLSRITSCQYATNPSGQIDSLIGELTNDIATDAKRYPFGIAHCIFPISSLYFEHSVWTLLDSHREQLPPLVVALQKKRQNPKGGSALVTIAPLSEIRTWFGRRHTYPICCFNGERLITFAALTLTASESAREQLFETNPGAKESMTLLDNAFGLSTSQSGYIALLVSDKRGLQEAAKMASISPTDAALDTACDIAATKEIEYLHAWCRWDNVGVINFLKSRGFIPIKKDFDVMTDGGLQRGIPITLPVRNRIVEKVVLGVRRA